MKLAVVGSRSFSSYKKLEEILDKYKQKVTLIVSGGAIGADRLAEWWAKENNIDTKVFRPDWDRFGKSAGFIRNKDIIEECDGCIAFWDGKSKGTKSTIDLCKKFGKPVKIIQF